MEHLLLTRDLAILLAIAGAAAWLCQRLGISVVVGYLVAGIVIGPFTPPFSLISSLESVHSMANLGLIFVLFFVGLELSLARLRALGPRAFAATGISALLTLLASRFAAGALDMGLAQGLFLGGILVVSSSAIIAKVLDELDQRHESFGQLALGMTVIEDIVAVAMLALLGSFAAASGEATISIGGALGRMGVFVIVLLLAGLLAMPRLIGTLRKMASGDVQLVFLTGLLLMVAWVAALAGYSVALGAFLLGTVLGGTRHKAMLESSFEPIRDLFSAVFFVSMGMLMDVSLFVSDWPLILILTAFALAVRTFSSSTGLILAGAPMATATRTATALIPLGEFSFVIAQLGVSSGLMPPAFFPATVGAALITTLLAPPVIQRNQALARFLEPREPKLFRAWRAMLERLAESIERRKSANTGMRIVARSLKMIAVELALLVALVACSRLLYGYVTPLLAERPWAAQWSHLFPVLWWAFFGLVLLVPLTALWRSLGALGMMLGELARSGASPGKDLFVKNFVEKSVRLGGFLVVVLVCAALLPSWAAHPFVLIPLFAVAAILALLLRGPLTRWQSWAQAEVMGGLTAPAPEHEAAPSKGPQLATHKRGEREHVHALERAPVELHVHEHVLSDLCPASGWTLGALGLRNRFGCAVVGIERGGIALTHPSAESMLFPGDSLLLVGTTEQLEAVDEWLNTEDPSPRAESGFTELQTDSLQVPEEFAAAGKSLLQLNIAGRFGLQVLAITRGEDVIPMPSGDVAVEANDTLFIMGRRGNNERFRDWLEAGPEAGPTAA